MYTMSRVFFMVMVGVVLCCREGNASVYHDDGSISSLGRGLLFNVSEEKRSTYQDVSELPDDDVLQLDTEEGEDEQGVYNIEKEKADDVGIDSEDNDDADDAHVDHTGPEEIADDEDNGKSFGNKFWKYRRPAQPIIELGEHDGENSHLPNFYTAEEHYKNAFYCAGANDLTGLIAVLDTLVGMGAEPDFILEELRTMEGDNLLLYAVKGDAIDTTRYLLSLGSDVNVTDEDGNTPLQIAVSGGRADMINAISEIQVEIPDIGASGKVDGAKVNK